MQNIDIELERLRPGRPYTPAPEVEEAAEAPVHEPLLPSSSVSPLNPWIFDAASECKPEAELRQLQWKRLVACVERTYREVPFYQDHWGKLGFLPEMLKDWSDLERLGFTTKADLRAGEPWDFLAVPREALLRMHSSSGTTGRATTVAYAQADLDLWAHCVARSLAALGIQPGILVQNVYPYGLGTGGLGFHAGVERLGAILLPAPVGDVELQLRLLMDLGAQVLLAPPSFAGQMASLAAEKNLSLASLPLAAAVFGGEPWSEAWRGRLDRGWNIHSYDTYGLSEILGPGIAFECEQRQGLHLAEDHFIAEIVDFTTGLAVGEGESGELVLSAITKTAMPLLRYRTGDRTHFLTGACPCGRTSRRIGRIVGREQECMQVNNYRLYPVDIEEVLLGFVEFENHYQIHYQAKDAQITDLQVELKSACAQDLGKRRSLEQHLGQAFERKWQIAPRLHLMVPGELPRHLGKAKRLVVL